MQEINYSANPFPGLRPFESTETHLFFGRDGKSEELLRRLKRTRFLAVVGTSGSGKSSLVRAGLLPALQGGLMASAGSDWRIAILRPGSDPIGNLARALSSPKVLGPRSDDDKTDDMQSVLAETTLRRSSLGLVELVRRARTKLDADGQPLFPDYENLLVVVDQFEELFRFKQLIEEENSKEDAAAFVKLLLEAVGQQEEKIYIVLTMRSDFLGDCSQFWELPEAINNGQYLIPRMTRDERREAIAGPVAVGQGAISEPLVNQLLNDVGDNPDQLPILQHALMRTWDYWLTKRRNGEPIDIPHYDAIGGMKSALSRHADEAYDELSAEQKVIAEKLFKGLTEKGTDNREIRRPMEVQEICELTGANEQEVINVIKVFRRGDRSFLMPPPTDPQTGAPVHLNKDSLIDISHESLIRNWVRLKAWVDEESRSARIYRRLAETAVLHKEGGAGLWRDPDLQVALTWRKESKPNPAWARRYHPEFMLAMNFLDESVTARDAQLASEEAQRRREIKRTRLTALIFAVAFLFSLAMGVYAYSKKIDADKKKAEADKQRTIAENAQAKTEEALKDANRERESAYQQRAIAEDAQREATKQKDLAITAQNEAVERAEDARRSADEAEKARRAAEAAKNEAKEKEKYASDRENEALAAAREAIRQIGENRKLLYSSSIGVAQKALGDDNSERAQNLLQGLIPDPSKAFRFTVSDMMLAEDATDLRGFEWHYLWKLANRNLTTLELGKGTMPTQADAMPASSPDAGKSITTVSFSKLDNMFVTNGGDNVVRMWSDLSKKPRATLPAQSEPVKAAVSINPYVFATGDRTAIKIWAYPNPDPDAPSSGTGLSLKHTIKLKGDGEHIALDASPRGNLLAIGSGATFMLWDLQKGETVTLAEGGGGDGFSSVSFVEDGKTLITYDGEKLTRWDVATRRPSEIELVVGDRDESYPADNIQSIAFTPDGKTMVTAGVNFRVWSSYKAGDTVYKLKAQMPSHNQPINVTYMPELVVAISPDGSMLATGDGTDLKNGGGVKVWKVRELLSNPEPEEWLTLSPNVLFAKSLSFSKDSRTLAVGGNDNVQLWDVSEKEPSYEPSAYMLRDAPARITGNADDTIGSSAKHVALSPDKKTEAVVNSVRELYLRNAGETSRPERIYSEDLSEVKTMLFSPDSKLLAVGGGGYGNGLVTLWLAQQPKLEQLEPSFTGEHVGLKVYVTSLAFSPADQTQTTGGSQLLASGGTDKIVNLWNTSTGKLVASLEGHLAPLTSVAFSPDGKTLASGDEKGTVNLWSTTTHQLLVTLKASPDAITVVAFSADNNNLFTKDRQKRIRVWPASPREQVEQSPPQRTSFLAPHFHPNDRSIIENFFSYKKVLSGRRNLSYDSL